MSKRLFVPRLLWFGLFASSWVYLAVLALGTSEGRTGYEPISMVLAIAGSATAGMSLVAPRLIRPKPEPGGDPARDRFGTYIVRLIVAMALAEAVAIYGFVLGLMGAPTRIVLPFFAACWVLMLIRFPSEAKIGAE